MKRITESEKQRIIELHRNTPMKPFLFEDTQVPFKNNQEGDRFRKWVNYHYPKLAGFLELDPIGKYSDSYYNSYIMKAWNYPLRVGSTEKKMGDWYKEDISKTSGYSWSTGGYTPPKGTTSNIQYSKEEDVKTIYGIRTELCGKPGQPKCHEWTREDTHNLLAIASLATIFIPYVGFLISAGINAYDAKLYLDEGKNKEGSVSILFAILDLLPYVNKIKIVGNVTDSVIASIAKKLGTGGTKNLTKVELDAVKQISSALKTKDGVKNLHQGMVRWAEGRGIYQNAEKLRKFTDLSQNLGLVSGYAYGMMDAPGNLIYGIVGKSVDELILGLGYSEEDIATFKNQFYWSDEKDDEKMKRALTDDSATICGRWFKNRPVPLKYQTEKYKEEIQKTSKSLEMIGNLNPNNDCRYEGTFGKKFSGVGNDPYEYKFFDGKYFTKKKDDEEWTDVTNNQKIKDSIDKLAKSKGLVKDKKGLVYIK